MSSQSTSFLENYRKLREISQQLNSPQQIDVDQLVPLVEQATVAYKACKARIDEVERMLNEKLEAEPGVPTDGHGGSR